MAKRQGLIVSVLWGFLAVAAATARAFAVWPPSTALREESPLTLCGLIVIAFMIGIGVGVWTQKRNEHK